MTERLIGYEHDGVPLDTARRLAGLGFAAFAIDLFGKGIRGKDRAENAALIGPFREDRRFLQARIMSYISMLRKQPEIDSNKIAAIGYCFGGLSVLDLARSGADVCGVVSIHGLFTPPEPAPGQPIRRQTILTSAPFTMPMPMPMPTAVHGLQRRRFWRKYWAEVRPQG